MWRLHLCLAGRLVEVIENLCLVSCDDHPEDLVTLQDIKQSLRDPPPPVDFDNSVAGPYLQVRPMLLIPILQQAVATAINAFFNVIST